MQTGSGELFQLAATLGTLRLSGAGPTKKAAKHAAAAAILRAAVVDEELRASLALLPGLSAADAATAVDAVCGPANPAPPPAPGPAEKTPVELLTAWAANNAGSLPVRYQEVERKGPSHAPSFVFRTSLGRLTFDGAAFVVEGRRREYGGCGAGEGKTKQAAKHASAAGLLTVLKSLPAADVAQFQEAEEEKEDGPGADSAITAATSIRGLLDRLSFPTYRLLWGANGFHLVRCDRGRVARPSLNCATGFGK